jgi:tol-pal system protein YbgF
MKSISIFVLLFVFVPFAFAGTKEDLEQVQRNIIQLQQQFWDLGKQIQNGNAAFQDTAKNLQTTADQLRENQASLNAKLDTIANQLQAMNEKLEETNRRLRDLTGSGGQRSMVAPPDQRSAGGNGDSMSGSANPGNNVDESSGQPAAGPSQQPGVAPEQQAFQDAMAQYSRGKFEQALRGFQDLLDQYPNSGMADDAQYMIGESYYGMKEYVDAVTEYDKVIKRYPDSDKVPGAQLKKSFSLFALGKKGQGVVELQQIVQRYPSSKEAQIARQRLSELGLD